MNVIVVPSTVTSLSASQEIDINLNLLELVLILNFCSYAFTRSIRLVVFLASIYLFLCGYMMIYVMLSANKISLAPGPGTGVELGPFVDLRNLLIFS